MKVFSSDKFWEENRKEGITQFLADLIQNPDIRKCIKKNIGRNVCIEVKAKQEGHSHTKNIVSKPDIVVYEDSTNKTLARMLEIYQIKIERPISTNRVGYLREDAYLLDFLKTLVNYDLEDGLSFHKYQLEIIRTGQDFGKHFSPRETNLVILSYWQSSKFITPRIVNIISSIALEAFKKSGAPKKGDNGKNLLRNILLRLDEGIDILNGIKLKGVTQKRIIEFLDGFDLKQSKSRFLKDAFCEAMKQIKL
ncbi:MAG: hypothetical protein ACFE95_05745 [Candidatus Hodarchaeota archaeon]